MIEHSESLANLAAALAAAQAELPVIPRTTPGHYGPYADLASVREAVRPVLARHGLSIVQLPSAANTLTTMVLHASGEWIAGEMDLHQASTPQGQGSAISYARRYALSAALCLATEPDDDAELAQSEQPAPRPRQAAGRAPRENGAAVSEAQQRALHALARKQDMDRDALLAVCSHVIGRDIESSAELTKTEASRVISALQQEEGYPR